MTWQKEIYDRAQIYTSADTANQLSQDPRKQNSTVIRRDLATAYRNADSLGILNIEELTGMIPDNLYNYLLQASPAELAHGAGNLLPIAEAELVTKVRDNYDDALASIPAENEETGGLEGVLLGTNPQGLNQRGEDIQDDTYSPIAETHFKYIIARGAAARGNINPALSSFLPLTREFLEATNARMPHLLAPMANTYANKMGEKYLEMFKDGEGNNATYNENKMNL